MVHLGSMREGLRSPHIHWPIQRSSKPCKTVQKVAPATVNRRVSRIEGLGADQGREAIRALINPDLDRS